MVSNANATLLEHSSRAEDNPEGSANPRSLWWRLQIVPHVDIILVAKDLNFLQHLAYDIQADDPELGERLLKRVDGYYHDIESLSSVGGRMWDKMSTTTQAYKLSESHGATRKMSVGDLISGEQRTRNPDEMGIQVPD